MAGCLGLRQQSLFLCNLLRNRLWTCAETNFPAAPYASMNHKIKSSRRPGSVYCDMNVLRSKDCQRGDPDDCEVVCKAGRGKYGEVCEGVNVMNNDRCITKILKPVKMEKESLLEEIEQAVGSPLGKSPQAPRSKPLVLVISGPSGVGKDAVINRLKEVRDEIHSVVTATTRARRPGEEDGKDYFFVKREEFEAMIQKDELLEYAVVYGDWKGIPKRQVRDYLSRGIDCILRVDVQGAATIRSIMGSGAVFIFMVAESEAALVMRLVERKTETKEKLLLRIATAREELKRMNEFDYVVVNANGKLERTVSLISHIIDAEKARVHQREPHL